MKTQLLILFFLGGLLKSIPLKSQDITLYGPVYATGHYTDGSFIYVQCNGGDFGMTADNVVNGVYYSLKVESQYISNLPAGYTTDIGGGYLTFHRNNNQDGDFTIRLLNQINEPFYDKTITLHFKSSPDNIYFNPNPPNLSLGPNQSGTIGVTIKTDHNMYTSVNWSTDFGLRVNGGTSYMAGNTGNYNSQTISTTGSGGNVYINASNACGATQTVAYFFGPPYINPGPLLLVDSYSNVWQFTQGTHPVATYSFYVVAGSASLTPNGGDCYIQTSGGADVCVTGTNSNGTCTPYCFNVPAGGGGYMRAASPNPAKDRLTLQFTNTESLKSLPSDIYLYAENSTNAVRSVSIKDIYNRKAFEDGDKISLSVGDLPRGVYYVHAMPNADSKSPTQKIRVVLE